MVAAHGKSSVTLRIRNIKDRSNFLIGISGEDYEKSKNKEIIYLPLDWCWWANCHKFHHRDEN